MSDPQPPAALNEVGLPHGYPLREEWEVTPRQVKAMLDAGEDLLLIDCRTPGEHQHCRIEGATLAPLQQAAQHLDELARQRDRRAVVYCHHGRRSMQMTMILRQAGFTNVKSMAGGIDLWSLDIDPKTPRY